MELQTVALVLTLVGTIAYWAYTVFISPINLKMDIITDAITDVKEGFKDLRSSFTSYQTISLADRRQLSERLTRLEQVDINTNKRLDKIEAALNLHVENCKRE